MWEKGWFAYLQRDDKCEEIVVASLAGVWAFNSKGESWTTSPYKQPQQIRSNTVLHLRSIGYVTIRHNKYNLLSSKSDLNFKTLTQQINQYCYQIFFGYSNSARMFLTKFHDGLWRNKIASIVCDETKSLK